MTIRVPTPTEVETAAAQCGLSLTADDVASYRGLMQPYVDAYNMVAEMDDLKPAAKYPRTGGRVPAPEENRHNAWYVKTSIHGAASGPLKGKRIAIKDNIMVADVPMMNGSSILEGYVPDIDATVVTRILEAGGEIAGKTHCEY